MEGGPSSSGFRSDSGDSTSPDECPDVDVRSKEYLEWMNAFSEVDPADTVSPKESPADDGQTASCSTKVSIYKTPRSRTSPVEDNEVVDLETTPKKLRKTPLPLLTWADNEEVWQNIVYKEEATLKNRSYSIFNDRSAYLPRMRAILLDWIMEVCEVYHLRRNTYYLSVDYIDRYLTIRPNVPKTQLQLLGVSCLFISAKLEEIYPPKLSEFSYVCDGACTEKEILACEVLLLNILTWEVNPMTPTGWLNLYMQIHINSEKFKDRSISLAVDANFQYPQYSGYKFVEASHLIDLFTMDPGYLKFSYSTIAAGAMFFIFGKHTALSVSGLRWKQLKPCVSYMAVFHHIIQKTYDPRLVSVVPFIDDERLEGSLRFLRKNVPNIVFNENHSIQTHLINLDMFEKSVLVRLQWCGLNVEKVYIKKVKTDLGDTEYESCKDENPEKGHSVVMYELTPSLERIADPDAPPPLHPTDADYEGGKVNIFKLAQKTTVTFDDILSSIHNDSASHKFNISVPKKLRK
ncbi:PREDICTED: G1/S-specific cyclin-E [Nicrophorus vespilloides]|uniref:G1/S-specific cyclin-E n=1 Tax=Nicrophorus vespilloides TaxID=110193 RepID=A0ABM1N4A4_NICVS|nr:PREDICTED: G1/S-specific cyclin-E [Nicrophorus vespilloides]